MAPSVLLVDDDPTIRWALSERLRREDYDLFEAATAEEALKRFAKGVDLVLLDYKLPDEDGLSVLKQFRETDPEALVILLTAVADVDIAVEAMRHGAHHYLAKPFNVDEVALLVATALGTTSMRREVPRLRACPKAESGLDGVVGSSPATRKMKTLLTKVASSPASTVLLTGESGTGKDLAARAIHTASGRASAPFMNITCSALTETLLENELFGHERGAFTDARQMKRGLLESAHRGTVFLDEIGEMPPTLQPKLLRFLEDKSFKRVGGSEDIKVDVRVIAATSRDLDVAVERGEFREDLFYRLNVLQVRVPALRERRDDVPLLVAFFLDRFNREFHQRVCGVSDDAMSLLHRYSWPGNVRELRNAVERAMLLAERNTLTAADFHLVAGVANSRPPLTLPDEGINLQQLERSLVCQALERTGGNRTHAASLLGLNREQVRYRIEKFGLGRPAEVTS